MQVIILTLWLKPFQINCRYVAPLQARHKEKNSVKSNVNLQVKLRTVLCAYKSVEINPGPFLPAPSVENMPEHGNHIFNRNIMWTFEDVRMLSGTDMPIFGGQTQPCISLKLRDMGKPIHILTGLDYWLENLMCNVPDVVMCYTLDGLVRKHEFIETEDLPSLENSNFSPKVVRNVVQNVLSFLKRNIAKEGSLYHIFLKFLSQGSALWRSFTFDHMG